MGTVELSFSKELTGLALARPIGNITMSGNGKEHAMNSDMKSESNVSSTVKKYFIICLVLSLAGFSLIFSFCYQLGLDWQSGSGKMHYHPIFMSAAFLVFSGNTILLYRVMRGTKRITVKVMHAVSQLLAFGLAATGLYAIMGPKFNNTHSWIGASTLGLFALQWLVGLITFAFPGLSMSVRGRYKPIHQYAGLVIYLFACFAMVTGLQLMEGSGTTNIASSAALVVMVTAMFVLYTVKNPEFERQEDGSPLAMSIQDAKTQGYDTEKDSGQGQSQPSEELKSL